MTGKHDWQELMYRMFGTSSAKANDMRAAGLNALLGDVSASGNVGSGAAATAAESAQMMPTDYSFISDAANHGWLLIILPVLLMRLFLCRNHKRMSINLLRVLIWLKKGLWNLKPICKK